MLVTKKQLVNGLIKFIETELVPNVSDRNKKFVLAMAKDSLKENNNLIDVFLESPMVATLVPSSDDEYDVEQFSTILKGLLEEYQTFPITIPKIPLFSPMEKTIRISAEDVDKLMNYIKTEEAVSREV